MARRPLAAALILGASALVLTGCIPLPPTVPAAPTTGPVEPSTPADPTESSEPADPGTSEPSESAEPADGELDFTVDDGAGDTWSFSVTGLEPDPPMESGEAEPGTYLVGIVLDGAHVDGSASFSTCFDILVVGSDGVEYDWRDTIGITAVDDVYFADDAGFTGARAVVQLPEDVDPAQLIFRTRYGSAPDTIIEVQ